LEQIIPQNKSLVDYELEQDFPVIGRRKLLLNAHRIDKQGTQPYLILLSVEDITEKK